MNQSTPRPIVLVPSDPDYLRRSHPPDETITGHATHDGRAVLFTHKAAGAAESNPAADEQWEVYPSKPLDRKQRRAADAYNATRNGLGNTLDETT